ncbi:ComEC/Rec2 family competence protein [Neorhizobium sp. NCHU2750]|uniref:ComEC/Rec2 family competence protein n=1 Tax=Neorhizobium sp. NCHU2750 TaxID=1825976 RepID=UPI000EB6F3A5|nr:membrane protein [Neorhizobium sp. NCHU2750]
MADKLEDEGNVIDGVMAPSAPAADLALLSAERIGPAAVPVLAPIAPRRTAASLSVVAVAQAARDRMSAAIAEEGRYGHGFLFVPVAIGAGAVIWLLSASDPPFWPFALAAIVVTGAALSISHNHAARAVLLAAALVSLGMMLAQMETWRRATVILDTAVTSDIVGMVERSEMSGAGRVRYVVRIISTADPEIRRPPGQVLLMASGRGGRFDNGAVIAGRARLSPPAGPALPGLHDFAFSSYFDGIGAVGYFYAAPHQIEASVDPGNWSYAVERWLFDLRAQIGNRIRGLVPGDAGAFAAAIITDERRAISEETVEALRVAGLAHIVAISGLNMALAAGIFFIGLRTALALFPGFAQAWPVKKIAAAGALAMVTAYYLISGFGVSAQRAYIMMAVILIAVLLDRPSISLRNVALSAIIILVWTPSEVLGPSFQMSFAATAALVAGYAAWTRRAERRPREPLPLHHPSVTWLVGGWKFVAGIIMTSLIGSLATTMFSVEHFHRIATYGLAANLASMPIISFLVMPAGLIAMLLMPFGLDAPFIFVMAKSLDWVIVIARHVAGWGGDFTVGQQHSSFLLFGASGLLLLTLLRTRLRYLGLPLIAVALWLFLQPWPEPPSSLLIAEDGTLVGLRREGGIAVNRAKVPDFIYGQWRRARRLPDPEAPIIRDEWRDKDMPKEVPKGLSQNRAKTGAARLPKAVIERARDRMEVTSADRFECQPKAWCAIMSPDGVIVVVIEDSRFTGVACDVAGLVVAPRARFDECRSGTPLLSGRTLRNTGAVEIDFAGSPIADEWIIETAMSASARPWTVHRQYDWHRGIYDASLPPWLVRPSQNSSIEDDLSVDVSAMGAGGDFQDQQGFADPADFNDSGE